ncbi:MAG: tetratricopeptide repeat protein [Candidatus Omnitrophica bacterium]|nr:tetratricopeptide repeat protein [Candidatus Omnitrophota bacterium]
MKYKQIIISFVLIALLGVVAYGNSLKGEFLWDDNFLIKENKYIKDWSYWPKAFTENIEAGARKETSFYRPLQVFSYMLDYSFWTLDSRGYHLTNLILHLLAALMVFWFINLLYDDWFVSLLSGVLFVVHPIHSEAVAYISGRSDSLAAIFLLLTFIFYIRYGKLRNTLSYLLMLCAYILALLSRESSIILPVLLLIYHYCFKKKIDLNTFVSLSALAFAYMVLRLTLFRGFLSHLTCSTTLLQRIPGFLKAIAAYFRLLIVPFDLHMEYVNELFSFRDVQVLIGLFLLCAFIYFAIKLRQKDSLVSFSILWFFAALIPYSSLYPINAYMAEHWLYFPSIGFFIILARALSLLYRNQRLRVLAAILFMALLLSNICLSIRQNEYWSEAILFYVRTLKYAPNSWRTYYNLGNTYRDINESEKAESAYKKVISLNPQFAQTYNNLGLIYDERGKDAEAFSLYKKAVELEPELAQGHYNLGLVYERSKKRKEAIAAYQEAINLDPEFIEAYNNLGNVYYSLRQYEKAIGFYKKVIELDPKIAQIYYNLGNAYNALNRKDKAKAAYKKAGDLGCDIPALIEILKTYGK